MENNLFQSSFDQHVFDFFFSILRESDEFVGHLTKLGIKNNELDHCIEQLLNGESNKETFLNNETFIFLEELGRRIVRRAIYEKVLIFVI